MTSKKETELQGIDQEANKVPTKAIEASASGSSGAAAAAAARRRRERLTIELHHSKNPIIEGLTSTKEGCTAISSGELMTMSLDGKSVVTDIERPFFDVDSSTTRNGFLPNLKIDTHFERPFWSADKIISNYKDESGKVVETRTSQIERNFWEPDVIRTTIADGQGKVVGSLETTTNWRQFDHQLKDSAGNILREAKSSYEANFIADDVLCTRIK